MKRLSSCIQALCWAILITNGTAVLFAESQAVKKGAQILIGPNILVSRDGEIPHVELMIAANPRNPKNYLGGAITFTSRNGGAACKAYASKDGGNTWWDSVFPEQVRFGGADPQAAFGLHGTAYFVGLGTELDEEGIERSACHFYRSEDGGLTWSKPVNLGRGLDHEQVVVDHSFGKFAGRIYVGALGGVYPEYQVGVFRSDDDGRTFTGPVKAATGRGEIGINVCNMLLMSDGTLFVPYADFPFKPEESKKNNKSQYWFVISNDGGITYSQPKKIHYQQHSKYDDMIKQRHAGNFVTQGFPMFAVDNKTEAFRDRLYIVWDDIRFGKSRFLSSFSKDRGETWTEPKPISPEAPDWSSQYMPMVFVNSQGVLGVMWFDTRASNRTDRYHLYFTASVDGGETFLPAVQVSSAPSFPAGEVNLTPSSLFISNAEKSIKINGLSAYSRWGNGGDYMGLTADSNGVFHPFWADSRGKSFQIWTSPIIVKLEEEKPKGEVKAAEEEKTQTVAASPPKKEKTILASQIELIHDPIKYDLITGTAVIPIRLKNISKEALYGPFSLKVKALVDEEQKKYSGEGWENIPEILNATNGVKGAGAEFDYSRALRDFETLEPGAQTEAVEWRLKFLNPKLIDFFLEVEVMGFILKK